MNTGHDGSMGTLHANSPRECLSRIESMISMGGFSLPSRTLREMICGSIDVVIQAMRLRDGSRRITHITEVLGMEGDVITTQDVFLYDIVGEDANGKLIGYQEVPSVSSRGSGEFEARIVDNSKIEYRLSYRDLEAAVQQAHIHFGQPMVNGGISVWLCSNLPNPPAGTPPCPPPPATVTGIIDAADVVGPAAQGIAPGEIGELMRAIRAGVTYANVHSTKFPGGEIRGQVRAGGGSGERDDD